MDEVLAVGDLNFQAKCLEEFNRYRDMRRTVVIVTHDISVVERYCDRAMLLRNGMIKKIGRAKEIASAYISENMGDEERRLDVKDKAEKNKGRSEVKKNKIVKITNVELLDVDGNIKKVFKTGDSMLIKIYFEKNKPLRDINIGIGLYKDDNSYVFGYNSQMDNYKIENDDKFVILSMDSVPLLKGIYFIKCVCFGKIEEKYYDFIEKAKVFQVFPSSETSNYRGVVNIDHNWKQ